MPHRYTSAERLAARFRGVDLPPPLRKTRTADVLAARLAAVPDTEDTRPPGMSTAAWIARRYKVADDLDDEPDDAA